MSSQTAVAGLEGLVLLWKGAGLSRISPASYLEDK